MEVPVAPPRLLLVIALPFESDCDGKVATPPVQALLLGIINSSTDDDDLMKARTATGINVKSKNSADELVRPCHGSYNHDRYTTKFDSTVSYFLFVWLPNVLLPIAVDRPHSRQDELWINHERFRSMVRFLSYFVTTTHALPFLFKFCVPRSCQGAGQRLSVLALVQDTHTLGVAGNAGRSTR